MLQFFTLASLPSALVPFFIMSQLLRLLIILAGVWLVIHFVRRALSRRRRPSVPGGGTESIARMLRCERCGIYVPESEAITFRGKVYCSETHRREDTS